MTSPGTVARIGTRQVNVTKEIAIGMILGLAVSEMGGSC